MNPQSFDWNRTHIGPPANPAFNWQVRNDSLYLNFFDSPERSFFKTFAAMKAEGDQHWRDLWGCADLRCGPFNTECE